MAKALKSTKIDKALEGCDAAMDPAFVLKTNTMQPLMNLVVGNKKVLEAAYPALRAVSNFCDPEQGRNGHFGIPGVDGSYAKNGLILINKKSGSWKGLERIAALLRNNKNNIDSSFDGRTIDAAVRAITGVLESMHAHISDLLTGEGAVYKQKIKDVNGLFDTLVDALQTSSLDTTTTIR